MYIYIYIRCKYGVFGREITIHTYGHIRCECMVLANPNHDLGIRVGLAKTIYIYIYNRCKYGVFGREITIHTYGHIRCECTVLANPSVRPPLQLCCVMKGHLNKVYV